MGGGGGVCVRLSVCPSIRPSVSPSVSPPACLPVCVSLASDSSETSEAIITTLGMVTASDMVIHHVLIILTLTFIQGNTNINHGNHTCSIISETVLTIPITFAVKIVRLKSYLMLSQSDDLALLSRLQVRLKLDKCLTCSIIAISLTVCKL